MPEIGATLTLAEIYGGVAFPTPPCLVLREDGSADFENGSR